MSLIIKVKSDKYPDQTVLKSMDPNLCHIYFICNNKSYSLSQDMVGTQHSVDLFRDKSTQFLIY